MGDTPRARMIAAGASFAVAVATSAIVLSATGSSSALAGEESARIVGGERASISDYPYAVYLTDPSGFQFCGGTLVKPDKVVTAAHCAANHKAGSFAVVSGREDKQSTTTGTVDEVDAVWVHPQFTSVVGGYDVAVLTLHDKLAAPPLKLPAPEQTTLYQAGTKGTIVGWGRTSDGGEPSQFLLKATVPMTTDADCTKAYTGYQPAAMVCAGLPEGGVDTCQGDSGGPLIVDGTLAGISSWGEGCAQAGKPGVYTRVQAYSKEIAEQLAAPPVVTRRS